MVDRWSRSWRELVSRTDASPDRSPDVSRPSGRFERALASFTEALSDDLNVARALASMNEAAAEDHGAACSARELASLLAMDGVVGVLGRNARVANSGATDPAFVERVESLMAERAAARAARQWDRSDRIRAELSALGIVVTDGPHGASWTHAMDRD